MDCRNCKVEMVKGTAMAPVLGNYLGNLSHGATIYPVTATLVNVMKCPLCGRSVSFEPQRTTRVPLSGARG